MFLNQQYILVYKITTLMFFVLKLNKNQIFPTYIKYVLQTIMRAVSNSSSITVS